MSDRSHSDPAADGAARVPPLCGAAPAPRALLQLWLSPAFPVGSFAYSHGLECAAARGWVRDRAGLEAWLADLVRHGALGNDLVLLAHAWRATEAGRWTDLLALAELSAALQPTAERHLEATQQGRSFLDAVNSAWPCAGTARLDRLIAGAFVGHAVAVGTAAAGHGIPLEDTLSAHAVAFVASLVSAAIRLSIVGQAGGQRAIAALLPETEAAARRAARSTLDDLAGAVFLADIASIAHETQYTRLFRS